MEDEGQHETQRKPRPTGGSESKVCCTWLPGGGEHVLEGAGAVEAAGSSATLGSCLLLWVHFTWVTWRYEHA